MPCTDFVKVYFTVQPGGVEPWRLTAFGDCPFTLYTSLFYQTTVGIMIISTRKMCRTPPPPFTPGVRLHSPSSRAPWPCPSPGKDDGSAVSAWTSPPPAEALAVLWRDGPSGPRCGDGEGAGSITAEGGGGGAAASFDGGVGGSGRGATSWRGGGSVGDLRTRETVSGVGNRSSPGDGRRNAVFPRRGGGTGEVVVILREDARVPLGHVADGAGEGLPAAGVAAAVAVAAAAKGGGRLCKRAGLSLLRRVARVRVLSAEESAAKLPRFVCTGQKPEIGEGGVCVVGMSGLLCRE